ncbi:MAG: DMT family transporter [Nanoarchaeota archaeon]|nr:DMT family transporter [Nanoarchaeota archaeon]
MEQWVIFILIATVFTAFESLISKKILSKEHAMEFTAVFGLFFLFVCSPLFFFIDYSTINFKMISLVFLATFFSVMGAIFMHKSMRHTDVGTVMSLWVLGPGFVALSAFIFLGEKLSYVQMSGIGLLIIGAYVLESKNHQKIFDPFRMLFKKKYLRYVLISLAIFAFSATIDRHVLSSLNMQVEAFIAFSALFYAFFGFTALNLFHNGFKGMKNGIKNVGWLVLIIALFSLLTSFYQAKAISLAPVGLVLTVKRLATLIVIIIGGEMFHENNILKKCISAIIMIAGVLLIVL